MNTHSDYRFVRSRGVRSLCVAAFLVSCWAPRAEGFLFREDFEGYASGSNLAGQGGWDGLTNQGTATEMPVQPGTYLTSGQILDTRAITQADRIHEIGHALPALDPAAVSTLSVDVYAFADSINTSFAIGENPTPGPEIGTTEGFFADARSYWARGPGAWYFDMRGIAGNSEANYYRYEMGADVKVTLSIVIDGPAGLVYGRYDDGTTMFTTPSRPITATQIGALDAVIVLSDRSLSDRNGIEFDNFELNAAAGEEASICGDVNRSGALSASDALLVLRAAVGQAVAMQCPPPSRPLRTGQTTCHDVDGSPLSCIETEQDGELRLGVGRSFVDNGDGTISDQATGLMWEKLSDDGSIHDAASSYTWLEAFGKADALNAGSFAGYSDWRLPNVRELETLRNFDMSGPAIDAIFREPCEEGASVLSGSCAQNWYHWTSTTWSGNPAVAWGVLFDTGIVDASLKSSERHVRAVRSQW